MRKRVSGRQLKRDKNERKALFKTLLSSLVMYESIITTEAKAKAIKADADKLITKAKKGGLHAYRLVEPELSTEACKKLLETIAPRFTARLGGYTRIIRIGNRLKDNAPEVIIEWTEQASETTGKGKKATKTEDVESAASVVTKTAKKALKIPFGGRKTDKKTEKKTEGKKATGKATAAKGSK